MTSFIPRFEPHRLLCVETKACYIAITSVEALKRSLVREWAKIPQEHYHAAVDEFQRRLDMVSAVLTEAKLKNEVMDCFICIFPIILYIHILLVMHILN